MKNLDALFSSLSLQNPLVTIGNFDGVHAGHQVILDAAKARAEELQTQTVNLSFEPHPVVFFRKLSPHTFRLTAPQHKRDILQKHGVDIPIALPFNRDFAALTPEEFVEQIIHRGLKACEVHVGYDFNFGRNRSGTPEDLSVLCKARSIRTVVHEAHCSDDDGEVISSTRIRKLLKTGAVEQAALLLTRPHTLRGTTERGAGRGRGIGFPTANIFPNAGLMVPFGVYTTTLRVLSTGETFPSITNIGVRPTVTHDDEHPPTPNAESFILQGADIDRDYYDLEIEIELLNYQRPEQKFESLDALKAQIQRDVQQARNTHGIPSGDA